MVGGRDYTEHRLTASSTWPPDAVRQPGSSFKIFCAAGGVEEGILPQTQFDSTGSRSTCRAGRWWSVRNDEALRGLIPLTTRTRSDNTVFAQLALRIGRERIRRNRAPDGYRAPDRRRSGDRARRPAHCCTPIEMALATPRWQRGRARDGVGCPSASRDKARCRPDAHADRDRRVETSSGHVIDRNKPQRNQSSRARAR